MTTPICAILGHVDVGKTSLLDYLRGSTTKEDSDITQQLGLTTFNKEMLENFCGKLKNKLTLEKLLVIDTPGHENFTTIRQTGVVISNLVVVVIDIIKGVEAETKKCLEFVKRVHDTNFIIVLNKLDKVYGWKQTKDAPLAKAFNKNKECAKLIKDYINNIICQLATLELNACAYYDNKDIKNFVSMVPVSSKSGEGIADLVLLISKMMDIKSKKQNKLSNYTYGYILDNRYEGKMGIFNISINISGTLTNTSNITIINRDTILSTTDDNVKNIVIQTEGKEMKDKSRYKITTEINNTYGAGIFLNSKLMPYPGSMYLDTTNLTQLEKENAIHELKSTMINENLLCEFQKKEIGVTLLSPSVGIMSALISCLNNKNIPIMECICDKLTKEYVIKISGAFERIKEQYKLEYLQRYKTIIFLNPTFDNENAMDTIEKDVVELCKQNKINIMSSKNIHALMENFTCHIKTFDDKLHEKYKNIGEEFELQILKDCVFLKTTPLLFGIRIVKGQISKGIQLLATNGDNVILLGEITSIQKNKKNVETAKTNDEVCIKVESQTKFSFGKDFNETYKLTRYMTDEEITMNNFIYCS